jgi:septum formation protein
MPGGAGGAHAVRAAALDEAGLRDGLRAQGASAGEAAEALAELKAAQVSSRFPVRLVLGADQILECDGKWLEKPRDIAEARTQLLGLRNRPHRLHSSAVLVKDRARVWHGTGTAVMTMRDFSDGFLDDYLASSGEAILGSVGSYKLEAMGVQLFSRIDGDFFTILGLPLIQLIDVLREQGLLLR